MAAPSPAPDRAVLQPLRHGRADAETGPAQGRWHNPSRATARSRSLTPSQRIDRFRMSSTDTFLALDGPGALSAFRATRLLARLRAIEPNITAVAARHVQWPKKRDSSLNMV